MYYSQTARLAIYAPGEFGKGHSKTAEGVIRYARNPVVAVIDESEAGKSVADVMGFPCAAPIVASVKEALAFKPDALLLGTAWSGGHLPPHWRPDIMEAIKGGLDVINGLHDFLADDPEMAKLASLYQRQLIDVRRPPDKLPVASGLALGVPATIVLTVGTDCSVGKMTAALELTAAALKAGLRAKFLATGQTGIMICGEGIAIDRVIGDFMAGAAEKMVVDAGFDHDVLFVEGQGSLIHPGFSGVTLSLLHGACPHAMVLCHQAKRDRIGDLPFPIPDLPCLIHLYEEMAKPLRQARVVALAINTCGLEEQSARAVIADGQRQTGLPASDPVRFGVDNLLKAILEEKRP